MTHFHISTEALFVLSAGAAACSWFIGRAIFSVRVNALKNQLSSTASVLKEVERSNYRLSNDLSEAREEISRTRELVRKLSSEKPSAGANAYAEAVAAKRAEDEQGRLHAKLLIDAERRRIEAEVKAKEAQSAKAAAQASASPRQSTATHTREVVREVPVPVGGYTPGLGGVYGGFGYGYPLVDPLLEGAIIGAEIGMLEGAMIGGMTADGVIVDEFVGGGDVIESFDGGGVAVESFDGGVGYDSGASFDTGPSDFGGGYDSGGGFDGGGGFGGDF